MGDFVIKKENTVENKKCENNNKNNFDNKKYSTLSFVIFVSFGSLCSGLFVGWSSHAMSRLNDKFTLVDTVRISSYLALGATISPILFYKLWHYWGTKFCIILCSLTMCLASLITFIEFSVWNMLFGRFLAGIAIGALHLLIPVYIHDIAQIGQIQLYNCIIQIEFVVGLLIMYIIGFSSSSTIPSYVIFITTLIFAIGSSFLPESPRYLCFKDQSDDARQIILKFREIDVKCEQNIQIWNQQNKIQLKGFKSIWTSPQSNLTWATAKVLIAVFGLVIFEQLTAAISLIFYMEKILSLTYIEYTPHISSVIIIGCLGASIPLPKIFGYKWKTKSVLIWCTAFMSITMSLLGLLCHYQGTIVAADEEFDRQLSLILLGGFYCFYAIGPFRLTWHFVKRMLPAGTYFMIRSLLITVSWLTMFAVTRIMPELINAIGVGWLFWYISIWCMFAVVFFIYMLPMQFNKCSSACDQRKLVGSVSSSETSSELGFV